MAELTALIIKRGNIKGRLTRTVHSVNDFKKGDNIYQLKTRIPYLEKLLTEFNDVQIRIEELDSEAAEKDDQAAFEAQYFDTISEIQLKLEQCTFVPTVATSSRTSGDSLNNIKLPTLNLQKFSGSFSEWKSFYDTFDSLINQNERLNDCERFHYLKSCLLNYPLHAVESLPVSEANYACAWKILRKRYENKRLIVQEHILAIINTPSMHKASHSSLRQLLDKLTSNLEALRVLEVPVNAWGALIVTIIHEKLDNSTKTEWQKMLDAEIPKQADFIKFLEKRLEILASFETVIKPQQTYKGFSNIHKTNNYQSSAPKQVSYVATHKAQCAQCKRASHNIYQCTQFLKLSTTERVNQTEKLNLCKNCLRNNHSTEECRSNQVCTECKQKHHSLLHLVANKASSSEISRPSCNLAETSATSVNCSNCGIVSSCVLLSTALVYIKDCKGKFQESRALLDVGSQSCFISIEMCGRLGLQCENVNIPVAGINQNYSTITQTATIEIKSRINNFTAELKCLLLPKISQNIPLESFNVECVKIPPNIILADPKFNESRQIDLLIGADLFWKLLCDGRIQTKVSQPLFQKTQLGWVIGGTINLPAAGATVACNLSLNAKRGIERLESGLNKFWELEEYRTKKILSFEERECEQRFKDSVRRTPEGRFMVKLPVNGNNINLGCSYELALKRFYSLEKRLGKQPQLKEQYSKFITEYLELNHMEAVPDNELNNAHCYLPHHAVIKDASTTTKLRVVFDASAKTTNGLSLNDNLMCGPVVQQDLFTILTRFRTFQYVLTGDIAMMYRQIMIHPSQMDYQRILWRNNADDSIQSFRLRTLTYGTKPASFLATRCLQELASNKSEQLSGDQRNN